MNVRTNTCLTCGQSIMMAGICFAFGADVDPHKAPASEHAPRNASVSRRVMSMHRKDEPASRTLLRIMLGTTFTLFSLTAILRPITNTPQEAQTPSDAIPPVEQSQWESVARGFEEMGAAVRSYNPDQPNLMAARLVSPAVVVVPRSLAGDIARSAQARLGRHSVVSLRDSSGKLLALATEYGLR